MIPQDTTASDAIPSSATIVGSCKACRQIGGEGDMREPLFRSDEILSESALTVPADSDDRDAPTATRRDALRLVGGGAALAAIASAHLGGRALAQDATPVAGGSKEGLYAVFRTRKVKPDKSIDDLTVAIREGFIPIVRAIPGFVEYYIVQNMETRERTSVSIFADKTGTDESTKQASAFLNSQGLADYYEDVNPVIQEGTIIIFAD
jgi:hypothetical protein